MTAQQLKNSILQMAVQGKLVPQDPNDEPASILLERIRAEKERLIKEKKIKREKNPSVIFKGADNTPYEKIGDEVRSLANEVPFDIPDSWEWVRVRNCTELFNGRAFKPSDWTITGLPIVRIQNLNDEKAPFNYYDKLVDKDVHLYGGELLFAWSGTPGTSFGAHIWRDQEAVLNQHIFKLLFDETAIFKPYYMYALNQRVGNLIKAAHGSAGLQHVTRGVFESTLIPLPPFAEQIRIVEKLNVLFPIVDHYSNAYDNLNNLQAAFPEALKKSILQEAVQGKLVPQDPSDEPAEALLERIRAEKQWLIKEGKIKKDKHESIIFRRDNSHYEKRGSEEFCIDDEIPFEIPENWAWARLSSASICIADGDHQPPPQVQDGIPFLVISNVSDGRVDFSNTRYVSKEYFASLADIRIPKRGDLLFTVTGSYGIVIPVQTERKFCFQRHIALIKLSCLSPEFMQLWLSSPLVYEQCRRSATGTAQKTVGLASLKGLLIPIPPLKEQERIAQKLNTLLALAAL